MNVVGIGIDIVDLDRFRSTIGTRTFEKVMTEGEIAYCESKNDKAQHYAGRFAATIGSITVRRGGVKHRWPTE